MYHYNWIYIDGNRGGSGCNYISIVKAATYVKNLKALSECKAFKSNGMPSSLPVFCWEVKKWESWISRYRNISL